MALTIIESMQSNKHAALALSIIASFVFNRIMALEGGSWI